MSKNQLKICLAALALSVSGAVVAEEIYKWTDAEGNVHYEDRPSGNATEERLQVTYNRTNKAAVDSRVQKRVDYQAAREEARSEAQKAKLAADEERAAAEAKAAKCTDYRAKMKTMLEARRVYREDENGERVYLDDAARAEARQKAEEQIKEYCGS